MRKIIIFFCLFLSFFGSTACASAHSNANLEGAYHCSGFDSYDGAFSGVITLKLDAKASDFEHNFSAYTLTMKGEGGGTYTGEIAAQGDTLAIYFENADPSNPGDQGVGVATVAYTQDETGKFKTEFHKSYFEPAYMRDSKGSTGGSGGHGTETCIKI